MEQKWLDHYAPLFLKHIQKTEHCWVWTGSKAVRNKKFTPVTYGIYVMVHPKKHGLYAHRFSYILHKGKIPQSYQIDHLCKNTLCVNPDHLEAVAARTNVLRGDTVASRNAAKTHCPKGHPYLGSNLTFKRRHGLVMRECRICKNARLKRWAEANRHKSPTT